MQNRIFIFHFLFSRVMRPSFISLAGDSSKNVIRTFTIHWQYLSRLLAWSAQFNAERAICVKLMSQLNEQNAIYTYNLIRFEDCADADNGAVLWVEKPIENWIYRIVVSAIVKFAERFDFTLSNDALRCTSKNHRQTLFSWFQFGDLTRTKTRKKKSRCTAQSNRDWRKKTNLMFSWTSQQRKKREVKKSRRAMRSNILNRPYMRCRVSLKCFHTQKK